MCGRYSFVPTPEQLAEDLGEIEKPAQLKIRFNIAPTEEVYVIANDKPHMLQQMHWGLLPYWSKDGVLTGKMINARSEGIEDKPSFRDPIRRKRCLVPADSFYEWRTEAGRKKTPYRILRKDGRLLWMAGIWDEWIRAGKRLRTVSIITTTPNEEMAGLHDRMPVIFDGQTARHWLDPIGLDEVLIMLRPMDNQLLSLYRVSDVLNSAGYESQDLHKEEPEQPTLF